MIVERGLSIKIIPPIKTFGRRFEEDFQIFNEFCLSAAIMMTPSRARQVALLRGIAQNLVPLNDDCLMLIDVDAIIEALQQRDVCLTKDLISRRHAIGGQ
jgi:hypothetical protein